MNREQKQAAVTLESARHDLAAAYAVLESLLFQAEKYENNDLLSESVTRITHVIEQLDQLIENKAETPEAGL